MEYDCSTAKRRKLSLANHVDKSESNKDQNVEENSNAKVEVQQSYVINGRESRGTQTDHFDIVQENNVGKVSKGTQTDPLDLVQENNESTNEIVMEESILDATEACGNQIRNEDNSCGNNDGEERLIKGTQNDDSDPVQENNESMNNIVMEESKIDATEACSNQIRNEDNSSGNNGGSHFRKKLLVLDINGLLVDIVADPDEAYTPDTIIGSKAVYKRPFCDEFLKFCFEKFNVGVWTSRTRRNIERVLKFLEIDPEQQLLFCWDQSHCTDTGFRTIENSDKPLVLKELKKLWGKDDPNLPWDKEVYNESNTIFLDDSPYKALRNPPYTAIFPYSYTYRNTQDNGLGPNGDLRNYLERLAAADNVQKFIEQNPFGQQAITYDDEAWDFYRKIIGATKLYSGPFRSRRKLIVIDTGGLLVDIATTPREGFKADTKQGPISVFKRPYCDEFLQFCFKKFNVGVWTSTSRYNTECTLDFLLGDDQKKLLFCWDRSHCTDTGFGTVENYCKTLILKELRKLWEKKDSDLPWEIGEYDESNTLLVENTPHKALLNPPHTGIFPYPYRHWDTEDNSLGPKGDLRVYLERLAASKNVQEFVSENPFGQRPIRETNLSWPYYEKIVHVFSSKYKPRANGSVDVQSSEPKLNTASAVAAPVLSESKADSTTVLASSTILEPETGIGTSDVQITTALVAPALLEPQVESTVVSTAPTILEPETDIAASDVQTTTALAAPALLEPKAEPTTVLASSTILEPETGIATSDVQTTTALAAPALLEPKAEPATVLASSTILEPETSIATSNVQTTTALAAPALLEPKAKPTTVLASSTIVKPETDIATSDVQTATALAAPTLLKPKSESTTDSTAPTLLEPKAESTTVLTAPTLLEPKAESTTVSAAPN